jgi:hypothetical protein
MATAPTIMIQQIEHPDEVASKVMKRVQVSKVSASGTHTNLLSILQFKLLTLLFPR